jgi:hypothetical protein
MQWSALAISVLASLALLGWAILRCRQGFEFTDEGFYLHWISNPWNFRSSLSQFGFVSHPLYRFLCSDIVLLRQANVLIMFGLAWVLCFVLLRTVSCQRALIDYSLSADAAGVAFVAAAGSLSYLELWLPTPNYNSLTFQSLLLVATGALLADRDFSKFSLLGWVLVGVGGGFTFLAKPTSAAMLGAIMIVYLALAGKVRLRGLSISAAAAVLCLVGAALAIDGSISGFIGGIAYGLEMGNRLSATHDVGHIFRLDGISLEGEYKFVFFCLLIIAFVAGLLAILGNKLARSGAALIAILVSTLVIATTTGLPFPRISREAFPPTQLLAVALGVGLAGAIFLLRAHQWLSRESLAMIALLAILPYAYAFGTATNYSAAAARTGLFWLLGGFVVCVAAAGSKAEWRRLLPLAALALVVPAGVLSSAMENPYRQTQPLRMQVAAVEIPPGKSRLLLSEESAAYIRRLQDISAANGFRAGDPALDLTGASPGSLYAMGARPLGAAWIFGGYPGSTDFLLAVLDGEACDAIAASWILTEPSAPDRFSVEMLRQFGIDIATDYAAVGSISSTRSISPQKFEHRLLKPVRSAEAARAACENARRTREKPSG